jgi:signal transduction histidine kinase
LKLLHKGLLLILVPLAFSTTTILYVSNLIDQADQQVLRQLQAARVLSASEKLIMAYIMVDTTCLTYVAYRQDSSLNLHKTGTDRLSACLRELVELLAGRPGMADKLRYTIHRLSLRMRDQRQYMSLPGNLSLSFLLDQNPRELVQEMGAVAGGDLIEGVIAEDRRTEAEAADARRMLGKQIQTTLLVGLGFSIFLTVSLGLFFYRNILERLHNVQKNIWQMSGTGLLIKPAAGSDEIAELDRAVHETASRLRSLEDYRARMIGFIGQQLKSPLAAIETDITNMSKAPDLNEKAKDMVEKSAASMSRLMRLADDLLNLEKVKDSKFDLDISPVNVSSIVLNSCAAVESPANAKDIAIETKLTDCCVNADADRLAQVLVNLLSNAVKFSPERSTVTVASSVNNDRLTLTVTDRGRGIPEEFRSKLFQRYAQVSETDAADHKGFGLGLSICKTIIDDHGGTIDCESEVGKGTTFNIQLPLSRDSEPAPKATAQTYTQLELKRRGNRFETDARLWQKGLAILAFPLLSQIVFFGLLGSLVFTSNVLVEKAVLARMSSSIGTKATRTTLQVIYSASFYHLFQLDWLKQSYENYKADLRSDVQQMSGLQSSTSAVMKEVNTAIDAVIKVGDNMVNNAGDQMSSRQVIASPDSATEIENTVVKISKIMDDAQDAEGRIAEAQQRQSQFAHSALACVIAGAVVFNVCLAGLLLLVAWKAIAKRIQHVIANTRNLLSGAKLSRPAPGRDEIADIDRAFYGAATKILRLQEFKEQLISVVGHDLRTPLTSVLGTFGLLSAGALGELSPEVHAEAAQGQKETERLIALINDLLDIEKAKVEGTS